jgi:hypothetical protein
LRRENGWEKQHLAEGIFHAATFGPQGDTHVVDVREPQQALDALVGQRLMPIMQAATLGIRRGT